MSKKIYIASLILITLSVCLTTAVNVSFAVELQSVPGQVIKAEVLTRDQFKALPDSAVIEVNGIRMTKQQLLAGKKRNLSISSQSAQFEAAKNKFLLEQKNKLDAENARVKAAFDSKANLRSADTAARFAALQKEAIELFNKSKNATPAEQQQIEQRAKELTEQLKLMGY